MTDAQIILRQSRRIVELENALTEQQRMNLALADRTQIQSDLLSQKAEAGDPLGDSAKLFLLQQDYTKLREAVTAAGFGIMQTSGRWSIHATTDRERHAEDVEARLIARAIGLESLLSQIIARISSSRKGSVGSIDNVHCCQIGVDEVEQWRSTLEEGKEFVS